MGGSKFWVEKKVTIHFTLGKNLKNSRARAVFKCVFLPRRETSRKLESLFFAWDGENFDQKNFTIHFTLGKKWKNSRAPTVFKSDFSQGARVVLRFYSIYRGQPRLFFFYFSRFKKINAHMNITWGKCVISSFLKLLRYILVFLFFAPAKIYKDFIYCK